MKYVVTCICTLFLTVSFFCCQAQTNTSLTPGEFEKNINGADSIQLLDVRTPAEYNTGHIKNALQADWTDKKEFERRVAFIDKNKPVYVYCLSGGRSGAAAKELRASGYNNVYELNGGINAWKAADKPLQGKSTAAQMSIEQFDNNIKNNAVVLVDFGAEWCPPCKKMEPVLTNLQAQNKGKFTLLKVDGGKDEAIMKQYNVTALPVFIIFKNGKQIWRKDGIAEEKEMSAVLKQ